MGFAAQCGRNRFEHHAALPRIFGNTLNQSGVHGWRIEFADDRKNAPTYIDFLFDRIRKLIHAAGQNQDIKFVRTAF